jgi:hypothetical protein
VYAAVQEKYWDVGFLNYYRIQKLPLFCLAAPMLLWALFCVCDFFIDWSIHIWSPEWWHDCFKRPFRFVIESKSELRQHLLPEVVHMAALATIGLLFMHVEVCCDTSEKAEQLPV